MKKLAKKLSILCMMLVACLTLGVVTSCDSINGIVGGIASAVEDTFHECDYVEIMYDENNHWNECACGDKAKTEAHKDENEDGKCDICNYTVKIPPTGDVSMMFLFIVLLCIGSVGVIVFNKKRSAR